MTKRSPRPHPAVKALCDDGKSRKVTPLEASDTLINVPARISLKGQTVMGFVSLVSKDRELWRFSTHPRVSEPTPIREGSIKICEKLEKGLAIIELKGQVYLLPEWEEFEFLAVPPSKSAGTGWQIYALSATTRFGNEATFELAIAKTLEFLGYLQNRRSFFKEQAEFYKRGQADALAKDSQPAHAENGAYRSGWNLAIAEAEIDKLFLELPEEVKQKYRNKPSRMFAPR